MLVVGALVGSLAIRRSPLRVFQRLLAVAGIYAVTAVGLFVYPGIWVPIASVQATALLAALFVLQFVFTADESELEKARAHAVRLDQELSIGREIQTSLLPAGPSGRGEHVYVAQHGCFAVVGRSEPSREVGGDFYDAFPLAGASQEASDSGGRLGLALGDVSGKGVPGALFMAVTMTLLQSHAHLFPDPRDVLARTNEALYPRMRGRKAALGAGRWAKTSGSSHASRLAPALPPSAQRLAPSAVCSSRSSTACSTRRMAGCATRAPDRHRRSA
jgi:hypothetical protein